MIASLYNRLTRPSDAILQVDKRRQAQLLASLILVIFVLLWLVEIASIIQYAPVEDYQGYWISIGLSLVLGGIYHLGRTRYFQAAVWLMIGALTAQILYFALFLDGNIYAEVFYYWLIPFLLGSFFLTERVTFGLFCAKALFLMALVILTKDAGMQEALTGPLILFLAVGGLVLALTRHRNRLEDDRRQELALERNLLRTVIDNVPDQIFVRDRANRFLLSNLSDACAMGVGDPALLVGKTDYDFYPPELAARYQADNRAVMESGQPIVNQEEPSTIAEDGTRWMLTTKVPLHAISGEVIGLVGIARDISELKRSEMERRILEKQLAHAHKLEALGQLAAGMAHEINTPAQYVTGNLRFVRAQVGTMLSSIDRVYALGGQIRQCTRCANLMPQMDAAFPRSRYDYLAQELPLAIDQSLEGIGRVTNIVGAMRTFSHPGNARRTLANINLILDNTLTVTRNHWKDCAEVETRYCADLPAVPCFPAELGQAFLNIILNAADAIGEAGADDGGKITISTAWMEGWVEVQIADTGCGIPEEIQERIFDYFFTTKEVGQGSGQGLAICHNIIVKMHGGSINVKSQEGEGTTFTIRMPGEIPEPEGNDACV